MSKNNLKNFIISLLLLFQANLVICSDIPPAPPMSISSASPTPVDGSSIPDAPSGDDDDGVPAAPPDAPPIAPPLTPTTPVTPVAPPVSPVVQPATPFTLTATNKLATIQNIFAKGGYLQAISEINKLLTTAEKDITAKSAKVNLSDAVDLLVAIRDSAEKQVASLTPLRAFLAHHDFYEGPIANATKAQAEQGLRDKFNPNNKTANALVQRAKKLHAQITGGGAAPTPVGPVIPMPVFGKKLAMQTIQIKEIEKKGAKEKTKVAQITAEQLVKHVENVISKFKNELEANTIPYLKTKINLMKDFQQLLQYAKDVVEFKKTGDNLTDENQKKSFNQNLNDMVTALALIFNNFIFSILNPTDMTITAGVARGSAKNDLFTNYLNLLSGPSVVSPASPASSGDLKADIKQLKDKLNKLNELMKDKTFDELFITTKTENLKDASGKLMRDASGKIMSKTTKTFSQQAKNIYIDALNKSNEFLNIIEQEINNKIDPMLATMQIAELRNIITKLEPEMVARGGVKLEPYLRYSDYFTILPTGKPRRDLFKGPHVDLKGIPMKSNLASILAENKDAINKSLLGAKLSPEQIKFIKEYLS